MDGVVTKVLLMPHCCGFNSHVSEPALSHLSVLSTVVPGSADCWQGHRVGCGEGNALKDEHSPGYA